MELSPFSYKLGKRTVSRLIESVKEFSGDDAIAAISPYLVSKECRDVEQVLGQYFAWHSIKWIYEPRGPPPTTKAAVLAKALCGKEGLPLDDTELEEMARESGEEG